MIARINHSAGDGTTLQRGWRWRFLLLLAGVAIAPDVVVAQSVVNVRLTTDAIAAGDSDACRYSTIWRHDRSGAAGDTKAPPDTVVIGVFADTNYSTPAGTRAPLELRLDLEHVGVLQKDSSKVAIPLGPGALAERRMTIWRPNSTTPLCLTEPFPRQPSLVQAKAFTTHTDIIASGEISNALRSGSENNAATGSLGFHHQSYPRPGQAKARFPWVFGPPDRQRHPKAYHLYKWTSFPLSGENLRAVVSVASAMDSVTGPAGANFAQAVLLPSIAPKAGWKSVDLEYYPHYMYGGHNQLIGPAFRIIASESRWAPDSAPDKGAFPTKIAVLVAFDARLRAVVINHVSDTDDNSLSFTIDAGYIRRSIGGDATDNPAFLSAALSDSRTRFTGWAVGTYLRLRQVTAYADFQCLSCHFLGWGGRRGAKLESLEGLQPVIGFRFDAPFFTVPEQ